MKTGQLKTVLLACAVAALSLGAADPASAAVGISVGGGVMKITGDGQDDHVTLKLHAGDQTKTDIDVNGDNIADQTVPNTDFKTISANLGDGKDSFIVSDINGSPTVLKQTTIIGGPGGDLILGGAGAELIAGSEDSDNLFGRGGNDTIGGGPGVDLISWSAADGHDTIDAGGDAGDLVSANGTNAADSFVVKPEGSLLASFTTASPSSRSPARMTSM
jgi:Ca2+-binding RTX toxin-like protein